MKLVPLMKLATDAGYVGKPLSLESNTEITLPTKNRPKLKLGFNSRGFLTPSVCGDALPTLYQPSTANKLFMNAHCCCCHGRTRISLDSYHLCYYKIFGTGWGGGGGELQYYHIIMFCFIQ